MTTGPARPAGIPVRWRVPLLAAGGFALLTGLYTALLLLELPVPSPRPNLPEVHGPVMVFGFVGTLVALERAIALGARWALLAPGCSAAGAVLLVLSGPGLPGRSLLAAAGIALLAVYAALWRRQQSVALLGQAVGAVAWYAATLLWLAGFTVPEIAPWLATFVVATIAGERLELAHVALAGPAGRSGERWFLAVLSALVAGATATVLWPAAGTQFFGAALLAVVAWLVRFDVARHLIRARGLPRYIAAGLLAGYAWLCVAGLLWAGAGPVTEGPRYDATLHAVFLGFTMSMIFVHAPVILPAVLRRPLPYHRVLYVPLALLHGSLLLRLVVGDAVGLTSIWRWSAIANVVAVLLFAGSAATLTFRGSRRGARTAADRRAMAVSHG